MGGFLYFEKEASSVSVGWACGCKKDGICVEEGNTNSLSEAIALNLLAVHNNAGFVNNSSQKTY